MKTRLKIVELCWAEYSLCARLHLLDDYLPKGLYCSQTTYPKEPSFVFHLYILMGVESVALGAPVCSHTTHSSFECRPHGTYPLQCLPP